MINHPYKSIAWLAIALFQFLTRHVPAVAQLPPPFHIYMGGANYVAAPHIRNGLRLVAGPKLMVDFSPAATSPPTTSSASH